MGIIDCLLGLTLNTNDSLKQFLSKILLDGFLKKIYPLSYCLRHNNINMAILLSRIHFLLH